MKFKTLIMGFILSITSAFVIAGEPNLDGPGALPPDAEPGQCFIHKFYPAKYEYTLEEVMIKEGYTYYNYIEPVFETSFVNVEVVPEFTLFNTFPPVFGSETVKIQVKPGDPVWKVKCCDKKHRHTDACEQACFVPQKPRYKSFEKQTTVEDGYYEADFTSASFDTVEVLTLLEDGRIEEVTVPPMFIDVKVYSQVHPGYMKWVEGTCKKWTCNPHVLQKALKAKGFYHGALDGVVGPLTIEALNNFRAEHDLGVHDELDLETAKMLGIEEHLVVSE